MTYIHQSVKHRVRHKSRQLKMDPYRRQHFVFILLRYEIGFNLLNHCHNAITIVYCTGLLTDCFPGLLTDCFPGVALCVPSVHGITQYSSSVTVETHCSTFCQSIQNMTLCYNPPLS